MARLQALRRAGVAADGRAAPQPSASGSGSEMWAPSSSSVSSSAAGSASSSTASGTPSSGTGAAAAAAGLSAAGIDAIAFSYSRMGVPMSCICLMVGGRSKAMLNTSRNIFFTLIVRSAEENTSGAPITCAYLRALWVIFSLKSSLLWKKTSNLVPTSSGRAVELWRRTSRNQSRTDRSDRVSVRSNTNNTATASAHAVGSIARCSRPPARSQIAMTTSAWGSLIRFSKKLTPSDSTYESSNEPVT
mmetsp:Transcript_9451/g.36897  ORF Transcript_9451/g.36897 Transcript_9451/m.36897 type:complete len:246 (+) Transcript_9451:248-985(+)